MKKQIISGLSVLLAAFLLTSLTSGRDFKNTYFFLNDTFGESIIKKDLANADTLKIGVLYSDTKDRKIKYKVDKLSTAMEGTDFVIEKAVIPANSKQGYIIINYKASAIGNNKKMLRLELQDMKNLLASNYNPSYTILIEPGCTFSINNLVGTWKVHDVSEFYGSSEYEISLQSNAMGGDTLIAANLWEDSTPVKIVFDLSNPQDIKVSIPQQLYETDNQYGAVFIEQIKTGLLAACEKKITISYKTYCEEGEFEIVSSSEWILVNRSVARQYQNTQNDNSMN